MPEYTFTGAYPRVLAGLSQGVNASITPAAGEPPVHGATLEASPGDTVHTDEAYPHPELEEVAGGIVPPSDPPRDTIPATLDAGYVIPDPAPEAIPAEGAPAPAEPTA